VKVIKLIRQKLCNFTLQLNIDLKKILLKFFMQTVRFNPELNVKLINVPAADGE